jgi:hypothetical protein
VVRRHQCPGLQPLHPPGRALVDEHQVVPDLRQGSPAAPAAQPASPAHPVPAVQVGRPLMPLALLGRGLLCFFPTAQQAWLHQWP